MELQSGSLANLTTKYLQPGIRSKMFNTVIINPTVVHDPGCPFYVQFWIVYITRTSICLLRVSSVLQLAFSAMFSHQNLFLFASILATQILMS